MWELSYEDLVTCLNNLGFEAVARAGDVTLYYCHGSGDVRVMRAIGRME